MTTKEKLKNQEEERLIEMLYKLERVKDPSIRYRVWQTWFGFYAVGRWTEECTRTIFRKGLLDFKAVIESDYEKYVLAPLAASGTINFAPTKKEAVNELTESEIISIYRSNLTTELKRKLLSL